MYLLLVLVNYLDAFVDSLLSHSQCNRTLTQTTILRANDQNPLLYAHYTLATFHH